MSAFTEKLDAAALEFFNKVCAESFSRQAVHFLNAYWTEIGDQADFIFDVAWDVIKYADMHAKGVQYIHLYDEGNDLEYNIGLYFYEKLHQRVYQDPQHSRWKKDPSFKPSMPEKELQTAIVRKQELREKVDVNFDGRIGFLEYLLYQYREFANPADFITRARATADSDDGDMAKALKALEEVNNAIRAYEAEKARLEAASQQDGVKGLAAKHTLTALEKSPLAEKLNHALISAEAAIRMITKKFNKAASNAGANHAAGAGGVFWLNKDLAEKKARYGK